MEASSGRWFVGVRQRTYLINGLMLCEFNSKTDVLWRIMREGAINRRSTGKTVLQDIRIRGLEFNVPLMGIGGLIKNAELDRQII